MKKLLFCAILGAISVFGALDRGGLRYDFDAISASRFAGNDNDGPNLFTDPLLANENSSDDYAWKCNYCYTHHKEATDKMREDARKLVRYEIVNGVGKVIKPKELADVLPQNILLNTSGGIRKFIDMPDDAGGTFRLSCQYQSVHNGAGNSYIIVTAKEKTGGSPYRGKDLSSNVTNISDTAGRWQLFNKEYTIPKGTRTIEVVFRIDALGELMFKAPRFSKVSAKFPMTLTLFPHGFLDNCFDLSTGQPSIFAFTWKRNGTIEECTFKKPCLLLMLPEGVAFCDSSSVPVIESRKVKGGMEYTLDLSAWRSSIAKTTDYECWLNPSVMVTTAKAAGSAVMEGRCVMIDKDDKDRLLSNVEPIHFHVVKPFKAEKPKHFYPGFYLLGLYANQFQNPGSYAFYYTMLKDCGARWVVGGNNKTTNQLKSMRDIGEIEVITPELFFIANGYRIGDGKGRPEEDKYVYIGTQNEAELARAACPASIYEKRPYFRDKIAPWLKEALAGFDGLGANWEPYGYAGRGCFCKTCMKKFADFVKVPVEQMANEWPAEVGIGKKYHEQYVRFRSLEHAKLVLTIDEVVRESTGGEKSKGFLPGVQYHTMRKDWRENGFDKETHPSDYAAQLRWIEPWGPYPCWQSSKPFVYSKIYSLRTFIGAESVREGIDYQYPKPNQPRILAFPHGLQFNWVTYPEAIAIDMLSFLFNGYDGATIYYFPRGYDNTFIGCVAHSNTIAARYDSYVFEGRRIDRQVTLTPVEPYALPVKISDSMTGAVMESAMLRHTAYEKNGRIAVSAFNFWLKGEAYFTMKVAGLKTQEHYIVRTMDNIFVPEKGDKKSIAFTGKELADGIMLQAGILRCVVFEIIPENEFHDNDLLGLDKISQSDVAAFRKEVLPQLEAEGAADREYEKLYGLKTSELKNIANGGIDCQADKAKGILTFTSGTNKAKLSTTSMCVTEWFVNGKNMIDGNPSSGVGAICFWNPSLQLSNDCIVTDQLEVEGGIEVQMERRFLDRDHSDLNGLVIRENIRFLDKLQKIEVITKLINESERELFPGMRYNIISTISGAKDGKTEIMCGGQKKQFERTFSRKLFTAKGNEAFEKSLRELFELRPETANIKIDNADVTFSGDGYRMNVSFSPVDKIEGVAVWDSGRQASATYEPCFSIAHLAPLSGNVTYKAVFTVGK